MEKLWGRKCPGVGCHHHYTERLEDAAQRICFGPTTGPEESVVKKFKGWFNDEGKDKDLTNVRYQKISICNDQMQDRN